MNHKAQPNRPTRAFATLSESYKACNESRTLTAENWVLGNTLTMDRNSASAAGSAGEPSKVISTALISRPTYSAKVELARTIRGVSSNTVSTITERER